MNVRRPDLTPDVDLVAASGTGPVRLRRPAYRSFLPPCHEHCPAGEGIEAWLAHAAAGRYREAWDTIVRANPLPAIHGRVCYHPCESACNRAELESAVSIHAVERYVGDLALEADWPLPSGAASSGLRVLVVGAGPAGLSAGYHLARLGHAVEIHDAGKLAGGMMRFGIPAYRLPRAVLEHEVRRLEAFGIRLVSGERIEDLLARRTEGRFDAVFVAIGAHLAQHIDIPAHDATRLLDAMSLLREVSAGERPQLGRRVVVYGGGNTALDAARTAKRLGATDPLIVYRRDRAHMPARAFEAQEAEEEGVRFRWLTTIRELEREGIMVEQMRLDAQGRPQPTGRFERIDADTVVLAIGQQAESAFLARIPGIELTEGGTVKVGANLMTGHPGIFAGGDLVPGERTVTAAVGHGRRAARHIDAWLRGAADDATVLPSRVTFSMLHLPLFTDVLCAVEEKQPADTRTRDFSEVMAGLSAPQAAREAQRCLSCGHCYECDICQAACPERAIARLGPGRGYHIDYERCTGCAVCFEACPCHAIEMADERA